MRNLKRALSLTLASVMLLGMMVVGSSAAGYPDVTEEENIEAIEVLQEVGVMEGDNNGNFNPDDYVTREQMAVIMSKLLNLDYNYYQGTNPFSDVPAWAAPYVAACAANGITSGIGGGMYGAGQNVNAVQAALMMLKALGYFQYQQDFGDDYVLATVRQATEVGLFAQIDSNANQALTRNEVAQMALNALQADLVRFTGDPGVEYTGSNGESWIGGYKAEYTPRTSTDPKYNRLIDNKHSSDIDHSGQYYCQLGEELYNGDLVKRYDSDIFERPSYTWTYKTELIGTYVDKAKLLASYTSGVKARELYDLLNNITIRDYDLDVYVDGHKAGTGDDTEYNYDCSVEEVKNFDNLVRSNTNNVGITGDGVLTEVYLDRDNEIITVASMHTWLANATSAYNTTRETATLKVYMTNANGTSKTVNVENVPEVETVAADAFYLVRMSDKDTAKLEVVDIDEPEVLTESVVTKFTTVTDDKSGRSYPTKLTTNGTEYKKSNRAIYDEETLDLYDADLLARSTYNVYIDKYGYFIGVDLFEGEKQYVFVTGYDMKNSNLTIKTAEAAAIFLDGTMDNITVNVKDTNDNIQDMVTKAESQEYYKQWGAYLSDGVYLLNRWYTYTKNDSDVYTLKPCVDKDGYPMMLAAKTGNSAGDELKLNCSKLTLNSVSGTGVNDGNNLLLGETMMYSDATNNKLTARRAYGEDESVFITVDVEDVSAKLNSSLTVTKAITDVNGVYTGVQDIDLITERNDRVQSNYYDTYTDSDHYDVGSGTKNTTHNWADGYVGENAYAVYDKNHFIIGAVILGEAEGAANTKAYILDPVKYERYENGTYYWQFEAVINGEKVTQEAQSKFKSTIDTMRKNQYEIVNLRYTDDIVTGVVELERTDATAGTTNDKIYGNPFDDIKDHQVAEKDTVYDVVLTGEDNATQAVNGYKDENGADTDVEFKYVNRARYEGMDADTTNVEHAAAGKVFEETELGYLNLQGRTLWVLNGQADHGVDFTRDAKAVVIQPENGKLETREYTSVAEAIDSLSDEINSNTEVKEFRGIITAALNSQGVAEWVVFFSDTNLDTNKNENTKGPYINIDVYAELRNTDGTTVRTEKWETQKVYQLDSNKDLGRVYAPTITGYTAKETYTDIRWSRDNDGTRVTFVYTKDGSPVLTGGYQAVRVWFTTDMSGGANTPADKIGTKTIQVPVDEAGYGNLTRALVDGAPAGYQIKDSQNANSNLYTGNTEVAKDSGAVTKYVEVEPRAATDIESIALHGENTSLWMKHGATIDVAALTGGSITFDVTYSNGTRTGVAAAAAELGLAVADKTTTGATVDGNLEVTVNTDKKCLVPVKIYADLDTDVTEGANLSDYAITTSGDTKGGTVTLTFTGQTKKAFDEAAARALVAKLSDDATGKGITLGNFTFKRMTTPGVAADAGATPPVAGAEPVFEVEVTITRTAAPGTAGDVALKVKASA